MHSTNTVKMENFGSVIFSVNRKLHLSVRRNFRYISPLHFEVCVYWNLHVARSCSGVCCACSVGIMSLLSWLRKNQSTKAVAFERPKVPGLPDPNAEANAVDGNE